MIPDSRKELNQDSVPSVLSRMILYACPCNSRNYRLIFDYESRITNHELRITNHELRITDFRGGDLMKLVKVKKESRGLCKCASSC